LLWGHKEYEPSKDKFLRFMSKKQYDFAQDYIETIRQNIDESILKMKTKRTADKIRYHRNKGLDKSSGSETLVESVRHTDETLSESQRFATNKETQETKERKQAVKDLAEMRINGKLPTIPTMV